MNEKFVPDRAAVKTAYTEWAVDNRGVSPAEADDEFESFADGLQADAWDKGLEMTVLASVKAIEAEEDNPFITETEMAEVAPKPVNPYRRDRPAVSG